MEDRELLAELQAGLKEQGVEATEEEIQAAVDKLEAGELSEDNLEDGSGGCVLPVVGLGLGLAAALLAICPRCRKVFVRKKGHRCRYSSGGGRHA